MRSAAERLVEWLRCRVPAPLLPLVVRARLALAWARPSVREDARAQMGFLLEHTRPEADLDAVARRYVEEMIWRGELRWHPAVVTRQRLRGVGQLIAARGRGRGVILNFMHHGPYDGVFPALAGQGVRCHMLAYPYMTRQGAPRWMQQHVRVSCIGGGTVVSTEVGTQGIVDLLEQGCVVSIASDVPGRTPVKFAGREVMGSFGAARIAYDTGAPVVVMTSERDEQGLFLRFHEPLEPSEYDSPRGLFEEMIARHERAVLAWPEKTDLPLARWGVAGQPEER